MSLRDLVFRRLGTTGGPASLWTVLLAVSVLVVVGMVLDRFATFAFQQILQRSEYRYVAMTRKAEAPVCAIISGNSRAGGHFPHTSQSGRPAVLNLGVGGMRMPLTGMLVKDYAAINGVPEIVIIEASFLREAGSGLSAVGITRVFSPGAQELFEQESAVSRVMFEELFHALRFNHKSLINALMGLVWVRRDAYVSGTITPLLIAEFERSTAPYSMGLDPQAETAFVDMMEQMNVAGVPVILVSTPMHERRRSRITNLAEHREALRDLAFRTGAVYLDYGDAIDQNQFFADTLHLNESGVAAFLGAFQEDLVGAHLPDCDLSL